MNFFEHVEMAPVDPILGLNLAFAKDENKNKCNLGVGAYKTADSTPFVLRSVHEAEKHLVQQDLDKEYLPIDGDFHFIEGIKQLITGKTSFPSLCTLQSVGGTGALYLAAQFLANYVSKKIYFSSPTWANHHRIFSSAGFETSSYPYYDLNKHAIAFDALCDSFVSMPPKSIVLFHACCHNPTGMDLTKEQWKELASLITKYHLFPLFDFAYQGFGEGLDEDAFAVRYFLEQNIPLAIATSYSKNFGLYNERIGTVSVHCASPFEADKVKSQLCQIIRGIYSNPPSHGARIVSTILKQPTLRGMWEAELRAMRERIQKMRKDFVHHLDSDVFSCSWMLDQKGMFAYTGLTEEEVKILTKDFGIYMPKDGRINVAGLNENNLHYIVDAIKAVHATK